MEWVSDGIALHRRVEQWTRVRVQGEKKAMGKNHVLVKPTSSNLRFALEYKTSTKELQETGLEGATSVASMSMALKMRFQIVGCKNDVSVSGLVWPGLPSWLLYIATLLLPGYIPHSTLLLAAAAVLLLLTTIVLPDRALYHLGLRTLSRSSLWISGVCCRGLETAVRSNLMVW